MKVSYLLSALIIMLFGGSSYAQYSYWEGFGNPDDNRAIIVVNGKYGAIDKSGKIIVQPQYDKLFPFFNGFATFKSRGKFGILDSLGSEVLPPTYDSIGYNSEGFTQFWSNGKMGFLNNEGNVAIRPIYTSGDAMINGMAPVHINTTLGEKAGVIDNKGKFIVRPVYFNTYRFRSWRDTDLPIIFLYDKETDQTSFVNNNREVVELQFNGVNLNLPEFITDSLLIVSFYYHVGDDFKSMYGIIDIHGKIIKPVEYDYIGFFQYEPSVKYIVLSKYNNLSGKYGPWSIVDINFVPIISENIANKITNQYWKGHNNVVISRGDDIAKCFRDGLLGPMRKEPNDCAFFIDKNGNVAFQTKYFWQSSFQEGLSMVERQFTADDDIDRPCIDPDYSYFNSRFEAWRSKYGFTDTKGNIVIDCVFDKATDFNHGISEVEINGHKGYINKRGNAIEIDEVVGFGEGLSLVRKKDLYGYVNENGDITIPIKYVYATVFKNGIASVREDYGDMMGCIDKNGQMVIAPQYDFIYPFGGIILEDDNDSEEEE